MRIRSLLLPLAFAFLGMTAYCESPSAEVQGSFDLVAAPTTEAGWEGIKYERFTGETWKAIKGKWVRIEEKSPLPKSVYKIIMIPLKSDFEAIRMDLKSGKSWRLVGGNWETMD